VPIQKMGKYSLNIRAFWHYPTRWYPLPLGLILVLVIGIGCSNFATLAPSLTPTRDPASQLNLSQITCQESEISSVRLSASTAPQDGSTTYLGETFTAFLDVSTGGVSPTYTSFHCTIVVFENEAAAQRALQRGCAPEGEVEVDTMPKVGEEACIFGPFGVVTAYFRRDGVLVKVQEDTWGSDVRSMATVVDHRLEQSLGK
jgi:hypothetical protein